MYPLLQLICGPCSATVHDHAGDFLHHFFYEGSCYSWCIFWPLSATVRMWGLWSRLDDLKLWHCLVCGEMVVPRIPYLLPHVPLSANKFSAFLCHCGRVSACIDLGGNFWNFVFLLSSRVHVILDAVICLSFLCAWGLGYRLGILGYGSMWCVETGDFVLVLGNDEKWFFFCWLMYLLLQMSFRTFPVTVYDQDGECLHQIGRHIVDFLFCCHRGIISFSMHCCALSCLSAWWECKR